PLTFKNSRQSVEVAQTIDVSKLLVETDCPYLTPHPYRGKENEPMYVQYTFDKLSEIKGIDKEILAKQLEENLMTLWK
ncbi:MAG: TatD family hydrolase, partial [Longicatena sp.]|nr:TatD family hydrolase [Longicatena sp.]